MEKCLSLFRGNAQAFGQPESYLLGRAAPAKLDLLDGGRGAADAIGEVLLGQVERSPALLDPCVERASFCAHTLLPLI
jgi:hypothetical protein